MQSIDEIPDSWETEDVEVVTVNPHTGEIVENLASSGAGPQVDQVRGTILSKPCSNCEREMEYEAPLAALVCVGCGATEDPRIHENQNA